MISLFKPATRGFHHDVERLPGHCRPTPRALASRQPEVRGMDRRAFVTGLGAVLALPLAAEAQIAGAPTDRGAAATQVSPGSTDGYAAMGCLVGDSQRMR